MTSGESTTSQWFEPRKRRSPKIGNVLHVTFLNRCSKFSTCNPVVVARLRTEERRAAGFDPRRRALRSECRLGASVQDLIPAVSRTLWSTAVSVVLDCSGCWSADPYGQVECPPKSVDHDAAPLGDLHELFELVPIIAFSDHAQFHSHKSGR